MEHFGLKMGRYNDAPHEVSLPEGTVLKVDRIYIRKGNQEFSSMSFYSLGIGKGSGAFGRPKSARFWAKLSDCNGIECEIESMKNTEKTKLVFSYLSTISKKTERKSTRSVIEDLFKDHEINCVIYKGKRDKEYSVNIKYRMTFKFIEETTTSSLFGASPSKQYTYDHIVSNVTYELKDKDGTIIGIYNTAAATKKAAKDHYEKKEEVEA